MYRPKFGAVCRVVDTQLTVRGEQQSLAVRSAAHGTEGVADSFGERVYLSRAVDRINDGKLLRALKFGVLIRLIIRQNVRGVRRSCLVARAGIGILRVCHLRESAVPVDEYAVGASDREGIIPRDSFAVYTGAFLVLRYGLTVSVYHGCARAGFGIPDCYEVLVIR